MIDMFLTPGYFQKFFFIAFFCVHAQANTEYDDCFRRAGARFSLDSKLLKAIAVTESNLNAHAVSKPNANGTVDIGVMQINSSWLPKLAQYGIQKEHLFNPCLNIHVGAWILASNVSLHGATWRSVGLYNSPNISHQTIYVQRVKNNFLRLNASYQEK